MKCCAFEEAYHAAPWGVPVDLFFYRDPEELEREADERAAREEAQNAAQEWNAGADGVADEFAAADPVEQDYAPATTQDGGWDDQTAGTSTGWDGAPAAPQTEGWGGEMNAPAGGWGDAPATDTTNGWG